jgi:hypothetical protein
VQNIKKKFPMVVQRCNEVVSRAAKLGPDASIDVDQLALRVTLDVIGLVSVTSWQLRGVCETLRAQRLPSLLAHCG